MSPVADTAPRIDTKIAVWEQVSTSQQHEARLVATRWGCDVEDASQELLAETWVQLQRGLPFGTARRYALQVLLSPTRSPLRPTMSPSDEPATCSPTRARRGVRRGWGAPISRAQYRYLCRLTSSTQLGIVSRIEREAPLRCPACGGLGVWGRASDSPPEGARSGRCVENEIEARERWPLYGAPRKARDDQVWWCRRCGGWTWDPVAQSREVPMPDEVTVSGRPTPMVSDSEDEMIRFVEAGRRTGRYGRDEDGSSEE